jgi:hypothetical protein
VRAEIDPIAGRVLKAVAASFAALALSVVALNVVAPGDPYEIYSDSYLSKLAGDENAAQKAQTDAARFGANKPAYCGSRYYKTIAGGSMCD